MPAIDYWYSGKPDGVLTFSGTYKRLDVDSWAPPADGYVFAMLYANIDGDRGGEFRSRMVREDVGDGTDDTAYQTHYPKGGDGYLCTHVWFEHAEGGRPLHYELQSMDGETFHVNTRYAKFLYLPG